MGGRLRVHRLQRPRSRAGTHLLRAKEPRTGVYAAVEGLLKLLAQVDAIAALVRMLKGSFSDSLIGRRIDLYKEGDERYLKDTLRQNFERYGFHLQVPPIFRNRSMLDLARVIDRRRQGAKAHT